MSLLFDRVPRHQLGTTFRYKGWFLGLVPVYIDDPDSLAPMMTERNGVPTWWFGLVVELFDLFAFCASIAAPDRHVPFFFKVTRAIDP